MQLEMFPHLMLMKSPAAIKLDIDPLLWIKYIFTKGQQSSRLSYLKTFPRRQIPMC